MLLFFSIFTLDEQADRPDGEGCRRIYCGKVLRVGHCRHQGGGEQRQGC